MVVSEAARGEKKRKEMRGHMWRPTHRPTRHTDKLPLAQVCVRASEEIKGRTMDTLLLDLLKVYFS